MTDHEEKLRNIIIQRNERREAATTEKVAIIQAIRAGMDAKTIIRMMSTCIGLWTGDTSFCRLVDAAMEKTEKEGARK